ncbi:sensor histidine kinase [Saccharothrix variisporea]|uniref:histidine kinase n=1 Tax=Saccharothrix variisporea TaxID=543527 RepID=A0A495XLE2_9PSEU|nr:histidine kinase [Saccharothrix variisporea]RKT74917.1 signal transduction histidine kinase [Saccharothrix variisporea]
MHEFLRAVRDEPRPPNPPVRPRWDWALVGVLAVLGVLEGVLRDDLRSPVVSVLVVVGLVPTLRWRRTRPLVVTVIAFGVGGVASALVGHELDLATMGYFLLLPYSLFRWGSGREAVLGSLVVLANLGASVAQGHTSASDALAGVVILSTAAALGTALRLRVTARSRELDRAKLLERERLARDLHDTVAHHVSAMAIRAQAGLATAEADPRAAVDALRVIEAEASRALVEMRGMVRLLRHAEPADLAPNPGVADLDRLAGRSPFGPAVDVEVVGEVDGLSPSVGTAVYRLAQESVTNARRHARHASRIGVRVVVDDRAVRLWVTDDGERPGHPTTTRGHGLIGMAERAGLLGGTCEAGPGPDRGWTVTAVLPRAGGTA